MKISDLVKMDEQGEFRSDVQLSDYENASLNKNLLTHYIFSTKAPTTHGMFQQRRVSSLEVLDTLRSTFLSERMENRLTLVANYGHGKSHLALVLANFFSHPADSEEVQSIISRIGQALHNPAKLRGYTDFKSSRGEFLVVRLRGDKPVGLRQQFLNNLEAAMQEHAATRGTQLPFWYSKAEAWLDNLSSEHLQKANTYLAKYQIDVPYLKENIREEGMHEQIREVFKAIHGVYPDFGGEVSLKDITLWVIDEFCGPGKPLGGLFILFDEFSLFIQRYAKARPSGELQDLLNGIADRQGRCAFVALAQHDPNTVAENYSSGQVLESVKHELSRLPRTLALYSLLESVLDSYLKQSARLEQWWNTPGVKSYFVRAREIVLEHFYKRYTDELRWNLQEFEKTIVKGCFPLHPLTTAILATHQFQANEDIGTPRTVLGFVQQQVEAKQDEPTIVDEHPNVILPVVLVDYFKERISKKWYDAYVAAMDTLTEGPTEAQRKVLQALFLQTAVKIAARGEEQIKLLSHMSGLDFREVKKTLRELSTYKVIRYDPHQKQSSLWPPSARPYVVDDIIKPALEKNHVDLTLLKILGQQLETEPIDVTQLEFGASQDWGPAQIALTSDFFTPEQIREYPLTYKNGLNKIEEGKRGLVIWLIAETDEEQVTLRQQAEAVLDTAFENQDHPTPVVVILPSRPMPELIDALRRFYVFKNMGQSDREKLGSVLYDQNLTDSKRDVARYLLELRGGVPHYQDIQRKPRDIVVPAPYRAAVQAIRHLTLKSAVTECYRVAYSQRPTFYTQYPVKRKALREAVKKVSLWLLDNRVGDGYRTLSKKDVQMQLCEWLANKWGLLLPHSFDIQIPTLRLLRSAWEYLDQSFPSDGDERQVKQVLINLMNPPYGHDYNTVMLLFAAWIGYNQYELRFSRGGRSLSLPEFKSFFDESKDIQDFLNKICCSTSPLSLKRTNPNAVVDDAQMVMARIQKGETFSQDEAIDALNLLEQVLENPRASARISEIENGRERLAKALETARAYDEAARQILSSTQGTWNDILSQVGTFDGLRSATLVAASMPSLDEIKKRWEDALEHKTLSACKTYGTLRNLEEQKANEQHLKRMRSQLKRAGYPQLVKCVDQALDNLTLSAQKLRQREGEKIIVAEIKNMSPSASLKDLYAYQQRLEEIDGLSEETTQIRDQRLREINQRIEQYETLARELPQALKRVTSSKELEQHDRTLLRNLDHVEGTPVYESLSALPKLVQRLRLFFQSLESISQARLHNREDATQAEDMLKRLEEDYAPYLSEAQIELIQKQRNSLNRKVQDKEEQVHRWLQDIQLRFKNGENPEKLLRCLEHPPAFITDADKKQMAGLESQIRDKLEQNVLLHIESLFRSIQDQHKRQACIERLQRILDE